MYVRTCRQYVNEYKMCINEEWLVGLLAGNDCGGRGLLGRGLGRPQGSRNRVMVEREKGLSFFGHTRSYTYYMN